MIIVGRAVQGIGGGGLITLVNLCVSDLFSMRDRPKYLGFVGMVWALASSVGPVLGGVFTQRVSWRWCFYINLPITGICFIVLLLYLEIHNPQTPLLQGLLAIDWMGCTTSIGGTVMFLLGLEIGGITFPWSSPTVICLLVFGLVTTGIFILIEWHIAKYPIIPLRIFKHRSNIAALGLCYIHGFVFISAAYFLPLYFQATLGVTPVLSGVYLLLFSVPLSIASIATGAWISGTGRYLEPLRLGMMLLTTGIGLLYDLPDHTSWPKIIFYEFITGVGSGPNFQAPLIALQASVDPQDISMATSTFVFVRTLAASMSIVVGGVVFQNTMQSHLSRIAQPNTNITSIFSGASAFSNAEGINSLPDRAKHMDFLEAAEKAA
ncbi:hypothetical protein CLAIMM_06804 [Cladophialophora immunda]|nr:hypothetical protein CLAIMM_06804 [Cladophialophora immunda]